MGLIDELLEIDALDELEGQVGELDDEVDELDEIDVTIAQLEVEVVIEIGVELDEIDLIDMQDDEVDEALDDEVLELVDDETEVDLVQIEVMLLNIEVDDDEAMSRQSDELDVNDLQKYAIKQTEVVDLLLLLDEIVVSLVIDTVYIDLHPTEHSVL